MPDRLNRVGPAPGVHAVHGDRCKWGHIYVAPNDNHISWPMGTRGGARTSSKMAIPSDRLRFSLIGGCSRKESLLVPNRINVVRHRGASLHRGSRWRGDLSRVPKCRLAARCLHRFTPSAGRNGASAHRARSCYSRDVFMLLRRPNR